jgi:hypothetical protein
MDIQGGDTATRTCGGTSALLPLERSRAEFDVGVLRDLLQGGPDDAQRQRWNALFDEPLFDFTNGWLRIAGTHCNAWQLPTRSVRVRVFQMCFKSARRRF